MSPASGRYSRVYWSIVEDEKFANVYDDDRALAAWLRLLITAEMAYPLNATIPVGTAPKAIAVLAGAGLLEMVGARRYRIVGLAAERERRSASGRAGASARWSGTDATPMRSHSEQDTNALLVEKENEKEKEEEQRIAHRIELPDDPDEDDHLDAYYRLTASWPTKKIIPWLDELARSHGSRAVSSALAEEISTDDDRRTLLSRTQTRLERLEHERRKATERAAAERADRDRRTIETMPEEQRRANLERLRSMMSSVGLATINGGGEE